MMRIFRFTVNQLLICLLLITECNAEHLEANEALSLLDAGKVLPLEQIIKLHPLLTKSRVLDIHLEREDNDLLIYEFEILNERNQVMELEVDATNGNLIREGFEE